jgi:hypothetical protein
MSKTVKLNPDKENEDKAIIITPEMEAIAKLNGEVIASLEYIKDGYIHDAELMINKSDEAKQAITDMSYRLDFLVKSLQQAHMLIAFPNGFNIQQSFSDIVPSGNAIILISTKDKA